MAVRRNDSLPDRRNKRPGSCTRWQAWCVVESVATFKPGRATCRFGRKKIAGGYRVNWEGRLTSRHGAEFHPPAIVIISTDSLNGKTQPGGICRRTTPTSGQKTPIRESIDGNDWVAIFQFSMPFGGQKRGSNGRLQRFN